MSVILQDNSILLYLSVYYTYISLQSQGDEILKKAIIIYAIMFALTLLIPALVCFITPKANGSEELVTIFRQCTIQPEYYCLPF